MIQSWKLGLAWLVMSGAIAVSTNGASAQITPDSTLPNNSRVTPAGNTSIIEGGTRAGSNLFHSFDSFSVPTGSTAEFNNALDIQNIISRVTGKSISNIDGLIQANGTANLFLINPNGIVFGRNASLNIGGSFLASTANAIGFGDRGFFSATDKNLPSPLLTINPSALLFNQINQNAAIQNNSVAPAGKDPAGLNANGLRVADGKSLLLVGGNVSMDGGRLNANGGRVELGGLTEPGSVILGVDGDNLSLIFPKNVARADVSLTNRAGIYVTGAGGGNIAVNARNLEILGGTVLSAGIGQGLGTPETVAGDITLNATGEIKVAGGSGVGNNVRLGSQGKGGNITIDSGSFSLRDGAQLVALTLGKGNAGNVTVRAKDSVSLAGETSILSTVEAGGVGKGGNIDINAASLSLTDSAQLATITRRASATQPAGRGDAGNVNVNVTGAVDIAGEKNGFLSGIRTQVETGTVGNGGNITIDSGSFSLRDGAQLQALTRGKGNAGNVTVRAKDSISLAGNAYIFNTVEAGGVGKGGNIDINAASFSLKDGSQLLTSTRHAFGNQPAGRGDAGNINVNVTGAVDIAGEKNGFSSGINSLVQTGTVGNGGNITIDSGSFSLLDGAQLEASTSGQGNAGTIQVNAADFVTISGKSLSLNLNSGLFVNSQSPTGTAGDIIVTSPRFTLDNGGTLNARSELGNGGNINLQSDLLLLRRGAQISTTAGTAQQGGDGGNIDINTDLLVAAPSENSDITANAFRGNGGRVNIKSQGIFGIRARATETSESDITASSQFGVNGVVDINTPGIEPNSGLINLPTQLVEARVAQTCQPSGNQAQSEFVVTGRGGLPPSPDETLSSDAIQVDWVTLNPKVENRNQGVSTNITTPEPNSIVEATGWTIAHNGDVILTASATPALPTNSWQTPAKCHAN